MVNLITDMKEIEEKLIDLQEQMANIILDYYASQKTSKELYKAYSKLQDTIELFSNVEKSFAD